MTAVPTTTISRNVCSEPSKVLLEKLTVTQLVKKLSDFYESYEYLTMFVTAN